MAQKDKLGEGKDRLIVHLNGDTLLPHNDDNISMLWALKKQTLSAYAVSLYRAFDEKSQIMQAFLLRPLLLTPEKSASAIFDLQNYTQFQNWMKMQSKQENQQIADRAALKVVGLFLQLSAHQIYIKIQPVNTYAQNCSGQVKILAVQETPPHLFIPQVNSILDFCRLSNHKPEPITKHSQLEQLYYKLFIEHTHKTQEEVISQISQDKLLLDHYLRRQAPVFNMPGKKELDAQSTPILASLTEEQYSWFITQFSINQKRLRIEEYYRCSWDGFEGKKFWAKVSELSPKHKEQQLLIISLENGGTLGFYSHSFPQNPDFYRINRLGAYLPQKRSYNRKHGSTLINFSRNTLHSLCHMQFCMGCSENVLLCIGKCDIIITEKAVNSLCYFPVSYKPDLDEHVTNTIDMCGSKVFQLKDMVVYRFRK